MNRGDHSGEPGPRLWARVGASRTPVAAGVEAWTVALRLGATGLVLTPHEAAGGDLEIGRASGRFGRKSFAMKLHDIWQELDGDADVVVDLADLPGFATAEVLRMLEQARVRGFAGPLVVMAPSPDLLAEVSREVGGAARMLHSVEPRSVEGGAEAHAAALRSGGIDGVSVPEEQVSAGLVALMRRFGRLVIADSADYRRTVARALGNGVDGVCGSDPEALHDAWAEAGGGRSEPAS